MKKLLIATGVVAGILALGVGVSYYYLMKTDWIDVESQFFVD